MKIINKIVAILLCAISIASIACVTASAATVYKGTAKTGSYYTIYNVGSKKMLNVYGNKNKNNANVDVYAKDGTSGQSVMGYKHGTMTYNGTKFDKYYFVFKCATSRALNVYGSASKNNSNICLWSKTGDSTQDWILEYIPSKSAYVIRSANNPKYVLTATGSSNSSNVCLKTYSSTSNYQLWTSGMFANSYKAPAANSDKSNTSSTVVSPVKSRYVTSPFQPYYRQDYKNSYAHVGVDYKSSDNKTDILAFFNGTVNKTGYNKSVGNYIEIKHSYNGKTFYSYYFHLKDKSILVKKGDTVKAGTKIAVMGNTGDSSGVHLHFQITSASVINSNNTFHTPTNNKSYSGWSKAKQSALTSFTSSRNIKFYNPEIVLTKGVSVIG